MPVTYCIRRDGVPPITGDSITGLETVLSLDDNWPPASYVVLEVSDSLPPGFTDRRWGVMSKGPDRTVLSIPEARR